MNIHIINNLGMTIEFTCGEKEYELAPGQDVTIEVKNEDFMYLDQVR